MQLPSTLLENAVTEFAKLPGIGKKTALRLVLHLLKEEEEDVKRFSQAIERMRSETHFCKECFNVSDRDTCAICANKARNHHVICVVENIRDVIAVENTQQFNGVYHVLGGVISPLDGIGPDQLHIDELIERVQKNEVEELIFALNPNIQGDTTIFYIQRKLKDMACKVTTISRGIAFGGELEYADEMTLGRSLANRLPVENYVK
ncbi:MAG: recombination protein RecR [Pseudopedobacter saltans]|uniref:Recombination protein RecR n=1 Tax=Pseudopedobacter saltans TaxID=151895 RepID=A0A2W5EVJ5_9SPHI|nr:MAG: recombination protein RecR [Pseudopedobacter saltans]